MTTPKSFGRNCGTLNRDHMKLLTVTMKMEEEKAKYLKLKDCCRTLDAALDAEKGNWDKLVSLSSKECKGEQAV